MKRSLIIITIILSVTALAAQEMHHHHGEEGEISQALQLTPAQQSAWESAHADFMTVAHPLFEKNHSLGQQIETALKTKSADACTIGSLLIDQQGVIEQIRSAHQTLTQKLTSLLTPEQKTKYEAIQSARTFARERE